VDLTGDLQVNPSGAKGYNAVQHREKAWRQTWTTVFKQRLVVYPYLSLTH